MTLRSSAVLDANGVLRFLTRTPATQAQAAAGLFARGERIASELTALLDAQCLRVCDESAVREALHRRATSGVDIVNAYLAAMSRLEGLAVATFDRDFACLDVELLPVGYLRESSARVRVAPNEHDVRRRPRLHAAARGRVGAPRVAPALPRVARPGRIPRPPC